MQPIVRQRPSAAKWRKTERWCTFRAVRNILDPRKRHRLGRIVWRRPEVVRLSLEQGRTFRCPGQHPSPDGMERARDSLRISCETWMEHSTKHSIVSDYLYNWKTEMKRMALPDSWLVLQTCKDCWPGMESNPTDSSPWASLNTGPRAGWASRICPRALRRLNETRVKHTTF